MISKTYYRYIWLLNQLLDFGELSYEDIKSLWEEDAMNEGGLPLRTFHEHRKGVKEMFGVDIVCDKSNGFNYYIKNPEILNENKLSKWLLKAYNVPKDFSTYNMMKDRIILEEIPRGTSYLNPIIDAMRSNHELEIDYQKYEGHRETFQIQPYALKAYGRHWYLLGYIKERNAVRNLALDRILDLQITKKIFELPEGFDARKYYSNVIGIFVNDEMPVVKVRIRAYGVQMEYLRSLPLHKTQEEVRSKYGEFAEFTYRLCLTPELTTTLLSMGDKVEVLEPVELRDEIKGRLTDSLKRYTEEN